MKRKLNLVYVGLRLDVLGENPSHAFLHGKRTLYWSRLSYPQIGSGYVATQEGESVRLNPKQWPGKRVAEPKQEWLDADLAAKEYRTRKREFAKAKNAASEFRSLLKPICERASKLRGFERREFGNAIARMILTGKFLLYLALLASCGKDTSCRIIPVPGTQKQYPAGTCPQGQVVTGLANNLLTCSEVSVVCPTNN